MPKFGMNENSQNFNLKNLFYRGNDKVENDKGYYGDYNFLSNIVIVICISFATIYEGLDTSKYTVYFLVPLPYFLITVLFIKGLTLEGNYIGWIYLFKPDWSYLFTFQIWSDAAAQVLFSAGLAQCCFMRFGNHKKDGESLLLPTVCIPLLNFATSIYAAFALFAFVGHISKVSGIPIKEMPIKGMELCFVVYPNLLYTLPWPRLWSIVFFGMLTSIGLSTEYVVIEIFSGFLHGTLKRFSKFNRSQTFVTLIVCIIALVVNLIFFASGAGYYWLEMFDNYTTGINLIAFLFVQLIVLVYMLPLSDLEKKVNNYGEKFPKFYFYTIF